MHYFCHTSNSLRYINPLNRTGLFSHRPTSALTTPFQDWSPPSPLLLPLDAPYPVDCCCSCTALLVLNKRTAALPWEVQTTARKTCSLTHRQCRRNILVAIVIYIVIYIATFWLPSSSTSQHFYCPSHFTTQDVLSKCTPKNVLSKCMVKFVLQASSLLTWSHSGQACHCGTVI